MNAASAIGVTVEPNPAARVRGVVERDDGLELVEDSNGARRASRSQTITTASPAASPAAAKPRPRANAG
ncbi:MAG: hypothetical protein KGM43_01190, partial [Planctomycetota bacterium]|nr:hypothetical protein [Planctomycetota bacterium]